MACLTRYWQTLNTRKYTVEPSFRNPTRITLYFTVRRACGQKPQKNTIKCFLEITRFSWSEVLSKICDVSGNTITLDNISFFSLSVRFRSAFRKISDWQWPSDAYSKGRVIIQRKVLLVYIVALWCRYNRADSPTAKSTMSSLEAQIISMFQRDFLALLGTFQYVHLFKRLNRTTIYLSCYYLKKYVYQKRILNVLWT